LDLRPTGLHRTPLRAVALEHDAAAPPWPGTQRRRLALLVDQPFCRCGHLATIRDHIVPLAEGGLDEEFNVQPLCESCHAAKTQQEAQRGRH